eukprot:Sspe_Gene.10171::Locus_3395_Transcript_1_2_Confidence_0.778_Length_3053::g.10171::m.10171/K01968/E6.4.1.4A; 3-methylcrotonyl-CoA carboxylase alpha subunit
MLSMRHGTASCWRARNARWASKKVKQIDIDKILIANRGEITCRVIQTANAMGIKTVAVHCDAERNGKHVELADEAYRLGPPPAKTSYLLGDTILDIAQKCGAQAIHPGYGFLSENAEFAEACASRGVEFIGPPASAITAMGSKSESKIIMENAGVPCVPGYHGEDQSDEFLQEKADEVGYPLLIKAVLGGGGKGMRIVRSKDDFMNQLEGARREATAFFKDDRVLLERYIERPRHVEVQVFCDKHGKGVYLFERDCSVQRRHQKVLEEAPAPGLSEELRREMGETAVRAAKAVKYVGAGTVEFIFDTDDDKYYFMEMNTRLQVEHPVTEMITKLDLVKLQIEVARGKPLPFDQKDLTIHGHALEARIYAEDPYSGFLPGSGTLRHVSLPTKTLDNTEVRVDSGFREGDDVLVYYDPMIAKLIVWAEDRDTALKAMDIALRDYHVVGIPTNIEFLQSSVNHPSFKAGGVTTKFIETHEADLLHRKPLSANTLTMAAMASIAQEYGVTAEKSKQPFGGAGVPFRLNMPWSRKITVIEGKEQVPVTVTYDSEACPPWTVTGKGFTHSVNADPWPAFDAATGRSKETIVLFVNGQRLEYSVVAPPGTADIALLTKEGTINVTKRVPEDSFGDITGQGQGGRVVSPMPGKITKIVHKEGAKVKAGTTILVMEAMKMELAIKAPVDGVVEQLPVAQDDMVKPQQLLAVVKGDQ